MNLVDRMERFAVRRMALALVGLWAIAEAVFLPVVPDVGLCLLAIAAPRRSGILFAAVLVGAFLGSVAMAALAGASPDGVRQLLLSIPRIDMAMLADVDAKISSDGVLAYAQLGPGPPLKVYTAEWVGVGGDLGGVIVGTMLNRVTRIGPVVVVAAIAGIVASGWIRRHARLTVLAYAAAWTVFYGLYLR